MYDKLICVTNRRLCPGNFLERVQQIAKEHPQSIILREKDLDPEAYRALAERVLKICEQENTPCTLHSFPEAALACGAERIHLPLATFLSSSEDLRRRFQVIGTSVHTVREAQQAEALGADYLIAGHIFPTECKQGIPGRGLNFLSTVCRSVRIPVYAIGGINAENYPAVCGAGAAGACIMSGMMTGEVDWKRFN